VLVFYVEATVAEGLVDWLKHARSTPHDMLPASACRKKVWDTHLKANGHYQQSWRLIHILPQL